MARLGPSEGFFDADGFYRVSDWELLTGTVGGLAPLPSLAPGGGASARRCLEELLLEALQRQPCVVAFSGGRDSSALLCVATAVARREGLPDPVAATHDFSGYGLADESAWQELVIAHLELKDWHRVLDADGFDVLGPLAQEGLRRFGLLWPPSLHNQGPFVDLAAGGGSLIVGEGGDQVLGLHRVTTALYVLRTRKWHNKEALSMLGASLAPKWLRYRTDLRDISGMDLLPWLPAGMAEQFFRSQASVHAGDPLRWDHAVLQHLRSRAAKLGTHNTKKVLATRDVSYHTPLLDPKFVGALAAEGGPLGLGTRTDTMRRLFGDVVPDEICRRKSKASFGSVALGRPTRAFLSTWDGEGLDTDIVDIEEFRRACLADPPRPTTRMLLQSAWLASQAAHQPTSR